MKNCNENLQSNENYLDDPNQELSPTLVRTLHLELLKFSREFNRFLSFDLQLAFTPKIRTLRYGDYGLRTTAGSHFQDWDETLVFSHPTVASSRRCVVEGFYVGWKGGLRIHQKGMKKQFRVRNLRNSC